MARGRRHRPRGIPFGPKHLRVRACIRTRAPADPLGAHGHRAATRTPHARPGRTECRNTMGPCPAAAVQTGAGGECRACRTPGQHRATPRKRASGVHKLGHRSGIRRRSPAEPDRGRRRNDAIPRAGLPLRGRLHREPRRPRSRRAARRRDLSFDRGDADPDRALAPPSRHGAPARRPPIPPARTGEHRPHASWARQASE